MSWITEITPDQATGELATVYAELIKERGKVSNILQVHSHRPNAMMRHLDLYMDLMFAPGGLSRRQRELIAVAVSRSNGCDYCVSHHVEALSRYYRDPAALATLASGGTPDDLSAEDRGLIHFARTLTTAPSSSNEPAIAALRTLGFTDPDILLTTMIVAYFNFVNRIALGLGVSFNENEVAGYKV
jgi:uncharacterized peroxidase-related enzyme